ncbi:hypothetical protein [Nitrosopumilus ureiphilus]|uniref:Uncharacterized protein n=1 Tax=Nitrosopumilus ureiphilus TaxID=1470067 RepID=A0A7D5R261_9ARCH|nr:hypothetical protein [Nitrosopumilus ureiphilus]QLH07196.1 hypothetical protein C5F50_08975 [Nitrosopumilus ureiphilus]
MNLKSKVFLMASILASLSIGIIPVEVSAQTNEITVTPINEEVSLKKTVTTMNVPQDNKLPWGFVKGAPSEYVERYPVIIQFYSGEDPVHFAQVDVKGDGSYEYKFRVRNFDPNTGEFVNIFEGDYTVKIFRVIPNTNDLV